MLIFGSSDMFPTAFPPVLHSLYVCAGVPPSLANPCNQGLRNSSGSLAIFAAILRASSLLSNLAAERRPGSSSKYDRRELLPVVVARQPSRCGGRDRPVR
jgi:hypothetical protein